MDCTEWKGPGVVIGQDGAVIFVTLGTYVRVHQSRLRKVDGPPAVLGEKDNQLEETENHNMLPEAGLNENNCDTENESVNETPFNGEFLHSEDNSEPPHTSVQPRKEHHDQTDTSQTHSITAQKPITEGLLLKTGQVVTYMDKENDRPHTGKVLSQAGKATGWNIQKLVQSKVR